MLRPGQKVTLRGTIQEIVDLGGGQNNVCLTVDGDEEAWYIWLTEDQIAAFDPKRKSAPKPPAPESPAPDSDPPE